jgi:uncharacterized membrane protein YhfC
MTSPMILFILIALAFPLGLFIFERNKFKINIKPVLIGALIWFVFTQILEKIIHLIVFSKTNLTAYPWAFAVYGAVMAGLFEEVGRYWAFTKLLKQYRKWKDALAYGTGHGGFEAIFLGIMLPVQTLLLSKMKPAQLKALGEESAVVVKALMVNMQNYGFWLVGGLERIMAVVLHIALSFIVFYAVKTKKIKFLFLAILYHAVVDFFPALFQAKIIQLWVVETILFFFTILNIFFIVKSKDLRAMNSI